LLEPNPDHLFPAPEIDVERKEFAPAAFRTPPRVTTQHVSFQGCVQGFTALHFAAYLCHPSPYRSYALETFVIVRQFKFTVVWNILLCGVARPGELFPKPSATSTNTHTFTSPLRLHCPLAILAFLYLFHCDFYPINSSLYASLPCPSAYPVAIIPAPPFCARGVDDNDGYQLWRF